MNLKKKPKKTEKKSLKTQKKNPQSDNNMRMQQ